MMRGRFVLLTSNEYSYFNIKCNTLSFISLDNQRKQLFGSINYIKFGKVAAK